jgi:WD40 repeat protein
MSVSNTLDINARRCPYCKEDSVNETMRLKIHNPEPAGCLGLIVGTGFSMLRSMPFFLFLAGFGLMALSFIGETNLYLCFAAIPLFFILALWRKWTPSMWSIIFQLLSWGTFFLDPNENAHYVYDRNCTSCGATWSRSSYESWVDIHLSTRCSRCRFEFATAPILASRCLYCGAKEIEILGASRPIHERKSGTIQQWLQSKDAIAENKNQRDFIRTLIKDGSPHAVELISELVALDLSGGIQRKVMDRIENLKDQQAIDAVCCVWSATRSEKLSEILLEKAWVASEPEGVRVLTALKVGHLDMAQGKNPAVLEAITRTCDDEEPLIAERARKIYMGFDDGTIRETFYGLSLKRDYPFARNVVIESGYAPEDERQRALFFLMTEQWEQYDLLDFDRQFLRASYMTEQSIQPRIREKLRASGRIDFLKAITGEDILGQVKEMAPSELDLIIQTLAFNHEWSSLWSLAFEVPFIWSVRIIRRLVQEGWKPDKHIDQAIFQELASMVGHEFPTSDKELLELFPSALLQAQAKVPGRINAVAFSPIDPVIAVGTGIRKLVLWNYQNAERERVLSGFDHSIGQVVFAGNGVLVSAERTNRIDVSCSIYGWDQDQEFTLGTHFGSVTALAPVGDTQVLSSGRDGDVILWDVSARERVTQRDAFYPANWVRAMCVSTDNQQVALLHGGVELAMLPRLNEAASGSTRGKKARCAVFLPDGGTLAAGMVNGEVLYFKRSPKGNRLVRETIALERHGGEVVGIRVMSRRDVLITASSNGEIRLIGLENQIPIGSFQASPNRVTSMHLSANEYFMVVGDSEAELSFWDLRGLDMQDLLSHAFAQASVSIMPMLSMMVKNEGLSSAARASLRFADCILRHRFRFDIEIGEVPSIMVGEFDIEID